ncbi:MAG TPA: ribokinase [Steroidobacteraceae bacterium]|nr:ribokinase [Steroidobacteraceae bacterium]
MARVAVVGSSNTDLVTYITRMPARGETLEAPRFEMGPGGKGANQAVAAARLGSDVLMVGAVGDDMFGRDLLANFAAQGIDTHHVGVVEGVSSGVATILVEQSGENSILIVKGANNHVLPPLIDAAAADLLGCALILLQLEVPLETVYRTVALATQHGRRVILNPAPATLDLDLAKLRDVAFFAPNRGELSLLTGMPTDSLAEIEAASRKLQDSGIRAVITTLGHEGALLVAPDGVTHVPSVPVAAVDTTGAGDAFIGSFAHFLAGGAEVKQALHWAVRYAALSVTARGAQRSYGDLAAFLAFCATVPGGRP